MLIPYNITQVGIFSEFWISKKNFLPPPRTKKFFGFPQILTKYKFSDLVQTWYAYSLQHPPGAGLEKTRVFWKNSVFMGFLKIQGFLGFIGFYDDFV